jgi:hypothetical protein
MQVRSSRKLHTKILEGNKNFLHLTAFCKPNVGFNVDSNEILYLSIAKTQNVCRSNVRIFKADINV